jgi:hypothetical protein
MDEGIRRPINRSNARIVCPIVVNSIIRKIQQATVNMRIPFAKSPLRPIFSTQSNNIRSVHRTGSSYSLYLAITFLENLKDRNQQKLG